MEGKMKEKEFYWNWERVMLGLNSLALAWIIFVLINYL